MGLYGRNGEVFRMGFFKKDYSKPGPGVPKNAPRKKGISRFFELIGRDSSNMIKINWLVILCELPSVVLFVFALISGFAVEGGFFIMLIALVLALAASVLIGPARTAEAYLLTKMMRDDPGYVWATFKEKFKENFKSTALPGMLFSAITGAQIFTIFLVITGGQSLGPIWVGFFFLSILIVNMAIPYFYVQAAYLDMKTGTALKNSLLLAFGFLPRSFAGGMISLVLVVGQALLCNIMPVAIILPIFLGQVIPALINLMWIWPPVDKTFNIEKTLKERNQQNDTDMETEENTMAELTDKEKQEKKEAKELKHEQHKEKVEKEIQSIENDGENLAMVETEDPTL